MDSPKISIIVPVYKVEHYLRRCLDSIVAQTFTDWECILVDDGSPDNSGVICDEYAEKDSRFRVVHQENGGASSARNHGLKLAQGEYICFVDADDIVSPTYLEDFRADGADLYISGFKRFGELENEERLCTIIETYNKSSISFFAERVLNKTCFLAPWCKLFKKSIIQEHNIQFPIGVKSAEDIHFCLQFLGVAQTIMLLPFSNYYLRYVGSQYLKKYSLNSTEYKTHVAKLLDQINKTERELEIDLSFLRDNLSYRFWTYYRFYLCNISFWRKKISIMNYTRIGLFRYSKFRDSLSLYYLSLFPYLYKFTHSQHCE